MKKLERLSINPNKVVKSEELINLRGGEGAYGDNDEIACWCLGENGQPLGPAIYGSEASQDDWCRSQYGSNYVQLRCRTF